MTNWDDLIEEVEYAARGTCMGTDHVNDEKRAVEAKLHLMACITELEDKVKRYAFHVLNTTGGIFDVQDQAGADKDEWLLQAAEDCGGWAEAREMEEKLWEVKDD